MDKQARIKAFPHPKSQGGDKKPLCKCKKARVLLNYPKWEQGQVPVLGRKASKVRPLPGPTTPFHSADALVCIPVLGWDVTRA